VQTWQMRFSAPGRPTLFPSEELRRAAVQTVGRLAPGIVVLLSIVDDHLHLLLLCEQARVSRLAHDLLLALRSIGPPDLEPAWFKPVRGRIHLENTVNYLLTQVPHHGLPHHPALYTGNGFVDLVGARAVSGLNSCLLEALPRYRMRDAYSAVGLSEGPLVPADAEAIRRAGALRLVSGTTAALCVGPELTGRSRRVTRARIVASHLAAESWIRTGELAESLAVTPRTVQRLITHVPTPRDLDAVRRRLALEAMLIRQTSGL